MNADKVTAAAIQKFSEKNQWKKNGFWIKISLLSLQMVSFLKLVSP